jgi:hypothetical protein
LQPASAATSAATSAAATPAGGGGPLPAHRDVRQCLEEERRSVLAGCSVVFSRCAAAATLRAVCWLRGALAACGRYWATHHALVHTRTYARHSLTNTPSGAGRSSRRQRSTHCGSLCCGWAAPAAWRLRRA